MQPTIANMTRFLLVFLLSNCLSLSVCAGGYLDGTELLTIAAVSGSVELLGSRINNIPEGRKPLIRGHLPFEQSFQRWLGGECKIGQRNFLDNKFGSLVTPIAATVLLTGINLNYPRDSRGKDASQDLFLFVSGIVATKGVTDIAKGLFARERPFQQILGESVEAKSLYGRSFLQHSFFSGHASGAFFSASFLNLRVRDTMRRRMTSSEYKNWKWTSSGLLFGWASLVGLSRVHAYKHYLSDVIIGSAAGILLSELFYNFGKSSNSTTPQGAPLLFRITIPL